MIRTDVYIHASKDSMNDKGHDLCLSASALQMFRYALSEVKITIDVDEVTGEAHIVAVDGRTVSE